MSKRNIMLSTLAVVGLSSAAIAQPKPHVDVLAGYLTDTTFIIVGNFSHLDFTNVILESVAGELPGETLDFGPMLHQGAYGGDVTAGLFYAPSGAFAQDYDESYNTETVYRVKLVTPSRTFYTGIFSPTQNLTGGYVDFLGLRLDNDTDTDPVVATAVVPEPATWAMMLTGFGAIGPMMRRRRTLAPA